MAVSLLSNLAINSKLPDVTRQQFETIADMAGYNENWLPAIYESFCLEDGKKYRYSVSNSVDPVFGKWREVGGGAGDLSNYYTKNEIDNEVVKPVKDKADANETNIGNMTSLVVSTWTDLVTAINALYNNFMQSITYTDKKVVLTYRNGSTYEIDVSSIITDTSIQEFKNVAVTDVQDADVLSYDATTDKWINKVLDLAGVLKDAKDYTDEEIAKAQESNAVSCDEKPTYDSSTDTVTYKQNGETKTEADTVSWFYYKVDGVSIQTRWINGVEFTIDVGSINLDGYVNKTTDVVSVFAENPPDLSKIPDLAYMNGLRNIIITALGKKINTEDVEDSLLSESVTTPLSANQGKILDGKITELKDSKLDIQHDTSLKGKHLVLDEEGKIAFTDGESAENMSYENESQPTWNTVKKALDGMISKLFYVKPEITSFTMTPSTTDYEVGQTVTSLSFAWTYNKEVTNQTLTDVTLSDVADRSGTWSGSLKTNKTFTLSCGDGENTVTASKSIMFKNKAYWGSTSVPENYDSAFILGLGSKQFATAKKGSYAMTVGSGEYGYLCLPSSFGEVNTVWIGGFEVTIEKASSISFTNASGGIATYNIYKTGKSGLGSITMEVK